MILGKNLMKKMGLVNSNLYMDKTRCSAMEGSSIKVLCFIPVKLRVKGQDGRAHKTNKCMYFAEGVMTTLISMRALKKLECVPVN